MLSAVNRHSLNQLVKRSDTALLGWWHSETAPAIGLAGRHTWLAFRRLPFQGLPRPSA